jgi:oxaloacetate decarboxylase gamma subunit
MAILLQGLVLLVSGMGIVYFFLALLVWVMNRSARIVPRFNHILPDDAPRRKPRPAARAAALGDDALIAVAVAVSKARAA